MRHRGMALQFNQIISELKIKKYLIGHFNWKKSREYCESTGRGP